MTSTTRRTFLRGAAGVGTASLVPKFGWAAAGAPDYLAAAGLPDGGFCLVGLTADGLECFRLPLPDRGHAAAAHPERPEAVAFARRPGTFALVIDCAEGREVARLHSPDGPAFLRPRRFHAGRQPALHHRERHRRGDRPARRLGRARRLPADRRGADRRHRPARGAADARRAAASRSRTAASRPTRPRGGPSSTSRRCARTSPISTRRAARSSSCSSCRRPLRLNSLRHIAAGRDGTLAVALQWQGSELEHPPLLAVHRPGAPGLETLSAEPAVQRRPRNYAGSVAVSDDGRLAAITAPRGNLMLVFDLAGRAASRWSRRPTSAASPPPRPASPARPAKACS